MNALKADPRTVDLRALAQHFYSFGVRILDLFDEEEIVDILSDVSSQSDTSFGSVFCIRLLTISAMYRPLKNGRRRLLTMRIILELLWGKGLTSCAD